MTYTDYRQSWKMHTLYDMWPPVPTVSEKCKCGHKIRRQITSTITCAKCSHVVSSYERLRPDRKPTARPLVCIKASPSLWPNVLNVSVYNGRDSLPMTTHCLAHPRELLDLAREYRPCLIIVERHTTSRTYHLKGG